jgi:predicted nucleotidyltransferase
MTFSHLTKVIHDLVEVSQKCSVKIAFLGGVAVGLWGKPRTTYDLDLVALFKKNNFQKFLAEAKKVGFKYKTKERVKIIDGRTFLTLFQPVAKIYVDVFIADDEFQQEVIKRSKRMKVNQEQIFIVSPEDLILYKLQAGRERDLEDLREVIKQKFSSLDVNYLKKWSKKLGIFTFFSDEWKSMKNILRSKK